MKNGNKILYFGLMYLYEKENYKDALEYIDLNREGLEEELESKSYLNHLELLLKYRLDPDSIVVNTVLHFAENFNKNSYPNEQDKVFVFSVLLWIIVFVCKIEKHIESKSTIFDKALNNLKLNVPDILSDIVSKFFKTLIVWSFYSEEEKIESRNIVFDGLKDALEKSFDIDNLKIHLYDNN